MDLPMEHKTIKLNLKKNDAVSADMPVFLGTDKNTFMQWDSDNKDDFVAYQDSSMQASLVMWSADKRGNSTRMLGVFNDGPTVYTVEPMHMFEPFRHTRYNVLNDDDEPTTLTYQGERFAVSKVNRSKMMEVEGEQVITEDIVKLENDVRNFVEEDKQQAHSRTYSKFLYEIELFLVLDYAIFNKWMRSSKAHHYKDREREAIDNIRFYFAHVLNGMALRYKSLDTRELQIHIRPVGIYIAKTPKASYWTESYPIKQAGHFTEAYDALDSFEEWINDQQNKLPPFDQATLFTGNNLYSGVLDNGKRRTINGLADIMGVCSKLRASINVDLGPYGCIQTSSHELGHNLGAKHDGYDNNCRSSDQYIMATSSGNLNDNTFTNPLEFSSCSKKAFRDYMLFLARKGKNCLLHRDNYNSQWEFVSYLKTYLGQRYSADEQCKIINGDQSFYCGGGSRDETICSLMYCWDPSERKCHGHVEQRAADGTICGDGKWCMDGHCTKDSRASSVDHPDCVYGDYKDIVDTRKNYKCDDIGLREPFRCYNEHYGSQCCETCNRVRTNDPECEFGDSNPSYCKSQVNPRDCYEDVIRKQCCETCKGYEQSDPQCKYGDKDGTCSYIDIYRPGSCYQRNSTCCATCPSLQTGAKGCEWGDKVSWCRGIRKSDCYRSEFETNCCESCRRLKTGPERCKWGDRDSYCILRDCNGERGRQGCCQTCAHYLPAPAVTTTTTTTTTTTHRPAVSPITLNTPQSGCTDTDAFCTVTVKQNIDCYSFGSTCCKTCLNFATDLSGCEYGDKYSWCANYVYKNGPRVCLNDHNVRDGCCESCSDSGYKPETKPEEVCKDTAQWCSGISSSECYADSTETTCCSKCKQYRERINMPGDCIYGDRFTWCKPKWCSIEATNCCHTCSGFIETLGNM